MSRIWEGHREISLEVCPPKFDIAGSGIFYAEGPAVKYSRIGTWTGRDILDAEEPQIVLTLSSSPYPSTLRLARSATPIHASSQTPEAQTASHTAPSGTVSGAESSPAADSPPNARTPSSEKSPTSALRAASEEPSTPGDASATSRLRVGVRGPRILGLCVMEVEPEDPIKLISSVSTDLTELTKKAKKEWRALQTESLQSRDGWKKIIWQLVICGSGSELVIALHAVKASQYGAAACALPSLIVGRIPIEGRLIFLESPAIGPLVYCVSNKDDEFEVASISGPSLLEMFLKKKDGKTATLSKLRKKSTVLGHLSREPYRVSLSAQSVVMLCWRNERNREGSSEIVLIDFEGSRMRKLETAEKMALTALSVTPSGEQICVCDSTGRLFWMETSKSTGDFSTQHWHDHAVTGLAYSAGGEVTYSAGEKGYLCIWSAEGRQAIKNLGPPILQIVAPCFSMELKRSQELERIRNHLLLHFSNNEIKVIDVATSNLASFPFGPLPSPCITPETFHLMSLSQGQPDVLGHFYVRPVKVPDGYGEQANSSSKGMEYAIGATVYERPNLMPINEIDDGLLWLLEYSPDLDLFKKIGSIPLRERSVWSRPRSDGWKCFWRKRAVSATENLSLIAISESQFFEKTNTQRHRLWFYQVDTPSRYVFLTKVAISSPILSLLPFELGGKILFAAVDESGRLVLYQYLPMQADDIYPMFVSVSEKIIVGFGGPMSLSCSSKKGLTRIVCLCREQETHVILKVAKSDEGESGGGLIDFEVQIENIRHVKEGSNLRGVNLRKSRHSVLQVDEKNGRATP